MNKIKSVEHIWSALCSRSTLDADSNNLSLNNLVEKYTFAIPETELKKFKNSGKEAIAFPVEFEVVSRFYRSMAKKPDAFDYRLSIVTPDGKVMGTAAEQKIALKEGIKNMRVRNKFNTLTVANAGDYRIRVEAKDVGEPEYVEVASIPLELVLNARE